MQAETLKALHEGHQGISKCQLRAKATVFWPGINKDIEDLVSRCCICQRHQHHNTPEPLHPHKLLTCPWQSVSTDLFHWEGKEYLLIADYYSKFLFVRKITGHSMSTAVINLLRQLFGEHAAPNKVVSDNWPQYSSAEFAKFCKGLGYPAHHLESALPAEQRIERAVQTFKNILTKAKEIGRDPHMAMLCSWTTPIDSSLPSPGELLQSRQLRGNIPIASSRARRTTTAVEYRNFHPSSLD